jgi:protein transport protein SEC24
MQNPENTSVCFITYDVNIQFYTIPLSGGEPTLLWVGDINDPFVPLPKEKLMLKVIEDRERIDVFLDKLLVMHTPEHKKYQSPFLCTGAAIQAAKHLIEDEGKFFRVFDYVVYRR